MRYALGLATIMLLALSAGCTLPAGGPTASPTPDASADVRVANEANTSLTFEVWILTRPLDEVTLRRTDGSTETVDTVSVDGLALYQADETEAVLLPDRARREGTYRLAPGDSVAGPVQQLPADPVVVVMVERRGEVTDWLTARCGDSTLEGLDLVMRDLGPQASLQCGSGGGETRGFSGPPA